MTDLSLTVEPKSDQLNSDDLIAGPMTIKITKISANPASKEQPISVYFEGDNGKPYKPCKSMRRVFIGVWGSDGSKYTGRSLRIYRDQKVLFGGMEVGGIRISHMSEIDAPITMALTATKASRKPFTVHPLKVELKIARDPNPETLRLAREAASGGSDVFKIWWASAIEDERAGAKTISAELVELRAVADKEQAERDPLGDAQQ